MGRSQKGATLTDFQMPRLLVRVEPHGVNGVVSSYEQLQSWFLEGKLLTLQA